MPTISINLADTTFVSSGLPNNNMNFYPVMYVGADPSYQTCNGLLQITLPSLPVAAVDSAVMQFTLIGKSQAAPSVVTVNRATGTFSIATVTYSTQPPFNPTASQATVSQSDLFQRVSIDITELVNDWLSGTPNKGIVLTCPGGAVQFATNNIVYPPYFPTLTVTYSNPPPSGNSAYCFIYSQLANIIRQLMVLYPAKTMTIFLTGGYYIDGVPYEFDDIGGSLTELTAAGQYATIPLVNICAVKVADTTFDPSITFLTPPAFAPDCASKLVNAIHRDIPVSTSVTLDLNTMVTATGLIYRNEFGMLVEAYDMATGTNPVFIPVWTISGIETAVPIPLGDTLAERNKTTSVSPEKATGPAIKKLTEPTVI